MKVFVAVFVFLAHFLGGGFASAQEGITIRDPWVRAAPPSVQVLAGYMVIENASGHGKTMVGARSPTFQRVEFHETLHQNGMATMVARDSLVIAAGGKVALEPGGYHMMLIAPQKAIRAGDTIPLFFRFSDGTEVKAQAVVRSGTDNSMKHGGHAAH